MAQVQMQPVNAYLLTCHRLHSSAVVELSNKFERNLQLHILHFHVLFNRLSVGLPSGTKVIYYLGNVLANFLTEAKCTALVPTIF